jgi:biopolymer transport protein ExbB
MGDLWSSWFEFLTRGGFMMGPLVAISLALGTVLTWRAQTLIRGDRRTLDQMLAHPPEYRSEGPFRGFIVEAVALAHHWKSQGPKNLKRRLDDEFHPLSERMRGGRVLVGTLVALAPMAGLLGTVTGMIEMFDSLATNTFLSQTGGIAAGISQAMFTTEIGLVIAVPGLILGRVLDQKEDRMHEELARIQEEVML